MAKRQVASVGPILMRVELRDEAKERREHPFDIPVIRNGLDLELSRPVTFFVGENGSGKSTLLEAIAWAAGFGLEGGGREHRDQRDTNGPPLADALKLTWRRKAASGFFLRAETFFNFASYLEAAGSLLHRYGGKSLHAQSHGEAFLSLFTHRFTDGLFILDEPEAALSPQRQLAFLGILHELASAGTAQFLIATHSPMLMTLPGARVLTLDDGSLSPIDYRDTDHYQITKSFLDAPERFFRHLNSDEE